LTYLGCQNAKMGWWSALLLTSVTIYQCEANILLISNLQVTYMF